MGLKCGQPVGNLDGLRIVKRRARLANNSSYTRQTVWSLTVAKMYCDALRTGAVPNYPTEPALIQGKKWVR